MSDHRPLIGIALMVAACALLAGKDALAKTFLGEVSPLQTIWFQYAGNLLVMAVIAWPRFGNAIFTPAPIGWQVIRGVASSTSVVTLYWSLTYIPLADAVAMFMLSPLLVTALSPFVLGERIGWRRKLAVAVGFLGVVVILRPGFGGAAAGYYIGLLAGALASFYLLANRRLVGQAPPMLNVVYNALVGAIVLSAIMPFYWQPVPPAVMPKLAALVALAVAGQALMISAFNYAPAPIIAPYTYAMLLFAVLFGYLVFGTFPDAWTWTGIALIVGSGLYIADRERRLSAARAAATP